MEYLSGVLHWEVRDKNIYPDISGSPAIAQFLNNHRGYLNPYRLQALLPRAIFQVYKMCPGNFYLLTSSPRDLAS